MPGTTRFAISWARRPLTETIRQMFSWAPMSSSMDKRMTNPKLAPSFSVNTAVWVRKPGPIAEVAIRKAAATRVDRMDVGGLVMIFQSGI